MARKEARRETSDRGYLRQIFVTHSASLSHKVTEYFQPLNQLHFDMIEGARNSHFWGHPAVSDIYKCSKV